MLIPAVSQSFYYNQTLYKTDTSIRRTTDALKSSTDTCEVLNVSANYDLGKKVTLFNTRRLIDSSYLVVHTVQVKIKSVIKRFNFINMFLFQFVGFVQVNNLKQTLNRRVVTVHRFSIIILKFLGSCYVDSL